jgi:hypothetical protein
MLPSTTPLLENYQSPRELAKELGFHPGTLERWRREGRGPPTTKLGNKRLYHRDSTRKWLASLEVTTSRAHKQHRSA